MTLKYVLAHRNVNGQIYCCDLRDWLGIDDYKKLHEIQDELTRVMDDRTRV